MAPVARGPKRPTAPSRRPATPPAQQRRNAAAQPAPRGRAAAVPAEDETDFDADEGNGTGAVVPDDDTEYDEDNLPEVLDLSGVEPAKNIVLPRGWYPGTIESCEYGLSQSSAKPMLTWTIEIEYTNEEDEVKARSMRWWTSLAGEGLPRTLASLAKLDPELDLENFRPGDMDEHFADMEVMVQLSIRPDRENKKIKRNQVADVVPVEEGE